MALLSLSSGIHGTGLFNSLLAFHPDEVILNDVAAERQWFKYVNHNCYPNAAVRGGRLVALREIAPGVEITISYIEDAVYSDDFTCWCASSSCCGTVSVPYDLSRIKVVVGRTGVPVTGQASGVVRYPEVEW